ncbi:hypothetical protein BIW11_06306 [Tropilaelaps mercedesae]|uniref:Uncharacterized protein n=1 Tax=Tropilaelaps mercedesae TaxID=418985 RepID=A0A1V9XYM0_9ACAR|nr:hypothetical protein BIW11_06306 [Tropilaelaps mercedesae]
MQSAANREIPENEAAAQSRPRMMSAQRFAQKHRRKKEKARTESRKDIALVLRAPITLGHAAPGENPQPYVPVIYSAASTLSDRPAIFSYLQRLPHQYQEPFQFQSIPGFLGGPVIPNPTRNAIAIASGIEINHHNNPHKEKPVRSRLNRFFKKRAGHLSGSNGLISGHTHDNISHKKSFHLKFFHLPFLSIDFDSKIYKDESLVADIGRRTGRQSFIFSQ